MDGHTETPWECYPIPNRSPFYGIRKVNHPANSAEIVDTFMDTAVVWKNDAEFIVKAANCHDELIKALFLIANSVSTDAESYRSTAKAALVAVTKAGA